MAAAPIFIVSSGRSGTKMMERLFGDLPNLTMHHEYMVHILQPLAVRRYLGLIGPSETQRVLRDVYGAAMHHAATPLWGDSSNKASWLIPDLAALFPEARFVHLIRDGRKVASSYFHKLADECYDDEATRVLMAHVQAPDEVPAPPPEKRYWWPVPKPGDPRATVFRLYDRFERIAFHWAEINRVIGAALADLPPSRWRLARLEDLVADPDEVAALFGFLNLPFTPERGLLMSRPHNVNRPVDTPLTERQDAQFRRLAWDVMEAYGYDRRDAYVVNY